MKKTIAISHQKGGVGKSLLSLHLCGALQDCVILDLDTQNSCLHISNARPAPFNVISIKNQIELFNALDEHEGNRTVIIDCGGFDSDLNRLAIANADLVLTPVKDNSFEILAFKRFISILDEVQKKSDVKAYALINNVHSQSKDFERLQELIKKHENVTLLNTIVRQRSIFNSTLEAGTTVAEVTKFSKAAEEILNLIEEMKGL